MVRVLLLKPKGVMARPFAMGRLFHFSSEDHHFATDYEKQYFHDRQTETLENIIGIQEREQLRSKGLSVSLMSSRPNVFTRDISVYHLFTSKMSCCADLEGQKPRRRSGSLIHRDLDFVFISGLISKGTESGSGWGRLAGADQEREK